MLLSHVWDWWIFFGWWSEFEPHNLHILYIVYNKWDKFTRTDMFWNDTSIQFITLLNLFSFIIKKIKLYWLNFIRTIKIHKNMLEKWVKLHIFLLKVFLNFILVPNFFKFYFNLLNYKCQKFGLLFLFFHFNLLNCKGYTLW